MKKKASWVNNSLLSLVMVLISVGLLSCNSESPDSGNSKPQDKTSVNQEIPREKILCLGSISLTPSKEIARFLPITGYLARHLKTEGIVKGQVVIAKDIAQMKEFFKNGKVDIYVDSPFPLVACSKPLADRYFLRRWKKGVAEYHTVIFTKKDSDIHKLEDLKGKLLTFEEEYSTSGYLLPKASLLKQGFQLTRKKQFTDKVAANEIGYLFSQDDTNTALWVNKGKVAAGATDNVTYDEYATKKNLRILYRSINVPRQALTHRLDLKPGLAKKIREVLLNMDKSPEGKALLLKLKKTKKFDDLPGGAKSLQQIDDLIQFIKQDLNIKG